MEDHRGRIGRRGDPAVQLGGRPGRDSAVVARSASVRIDGMQRSAIATSAAPWQRPASRSTIGTGTGIDPEEIVHSRYIVLWGTNTIVTNLHFWPFVREAQSRGAKLVVVDPIRTRTAEAADWHLQIRPGSDAALALAMMHVIVRDGLVDHDYVSQVRRRLRRACRAGAQYAPERVAAHGRPAGGRHRAVRPRVRDDAAVVAAAADRHRASPQRRDAVPHARRACRC